MLIYILKSSACLGIFYLFYKLILENENMHVFKRFYLLSGLALSFIIPLITIRTFGEAGQRNIPELFITNSQTQSEYAFFEEILPMVLWCVYYIGIGVFSVRFCKNLASIILCIKNNPKQSSTYYTNILLQKHIIPHTFLKYIFVNKTDFESQKIPKEVLLHEQTHAIQRHSLDLLFVEVFQIIFWFNPLLYFIKKSIKLNHEFLADQAVLYNGVTTSKYQKMLLLFSTKNTTYHFTNAFNYAIIKKRFTIMTTKTSNKTAWFKSALLLPLLAILIFSFSTKEVVLEHTDATTTEFQQGATKAQIKEYNTLARKYNTMDPAKMIIQKSDVERLTFLYRLMSRRQLKKIEAFPNFPPPPPNPPKTETSDIIVIGVNDNGPNVPPPPPKPNKIKTHN